jgi:hypothetical protein
MPKLGHPISVLHAVLLAAVCLFAPAAQAEGFTAPTGDVLLTVSGQITLTNVSGTLSLDADQFATLPQHRFTTSTTWTDGTPTFEGVLLKDLMAAVGATGTTVALTALNDYKITIPLSEIHDDGPLLAYLMDGKPMSLRDKGPIWLVYPYDANAEYRTEQTYARSIWQLNRIEFTQ